MKKGVGVGVGVAVRSNNNTSNNNNNPISPNSVRGVRAVLIRKDSPEDLLLRRLKEYLLYSKLRALLPSQSAADMRRIQESSPPHQRAMEYEPEPHEIPARDSDDENSSGGVPAESRKVDEHGGGDDDDFEYAVLDSNADEKSEKAFVPSIKIKKMDSNLLLISTIVLKNVALSSVLFRLLEEEKLDIVCENQYRTETKVSHTIQVNLCSEDYDVGALELRLGAWARGMKT
ncbi:hypothetical protein ACLOJK_025273 [Asimina triloba]